MTPSRTPRQPKPNCITEAVRALSDAHLTKLIGELRFGTKLQLSTLDKALTEQRRRKRDSKVAKA